MKKINLKSVAIEAAAVGAGAVVACKVDPMMEKVKFLAGKPLFKGAAKIVAGVLIPHFLGKGKKSDTVKAFGAGMVAVGATQVANGTIFKAAPLTIAGVGSLPTLGEVDASNFITEDYMDVSGMPTLGETGNLSI